MSEKKRIFESEAMTPASLHLQKSVPTTEKQLDRCEQRVAPKQFFAPELINRLADKIKKL